MAELEGREPKVECRRLMDFDDAAKLKMCVLTDSAGDRPQGSQGDGAKNI